MGSAEALLPAGQAPCDPSRRKTGSAPRMRSGMSMRLASIAAAIALQALSVATAPAQTVPSIQFSSLPHIAIISPTFYWDGTIDVVRTVSATCPGGRPIAGGLSVEKGNASLRLRES